MQTLLITIAGPQKQVDLQVPGEVPVEDLLPALLEICVPSSVQTTTKTVTTAVWQLVYKHIPLSTNRSLVEAGVLDGAVLVLQDQAAQMTRPLQSVAAQPQHFIPRTVTPSRSTGGIGVTWSNDGLTHET